MANLEVSVTPRASADRVRLVDSVLRVWISTAPIEGEANRALIRLVARAIGVPQSSVLLVSGSRSRRKRLRIEGLSDTDLAARLATLRD